MNQDDFDLMREQWKHERSDLDPTGVEILWRIAFIHKRMKNQAGKRLGKHDLPIWSFDVLSALRRRGAPFQATPTELCQATMLTSGAMTNRLDRLELSGLVERRPDSNDRRSILIRLTPEGRTLVDKAVEDRFRVANEALSTLTRTERRQLTNLLKKLATDPAMQ